MDNLQVGYGFRPVYGRWGSDILPVRKFVASAYQAAPGAVSVDLNIGDPVIRVSDGSVAIAGVTGAIYGIIVGVEPYWDSVNGVMRFSDRLPGGVTWGTIQERQSRLLVLPVYGMRFAVYADDAVTATTVGGYQALVGENVNTIYAADATAKKAYPKVDISAHATTNTFQWNIVDISTSQNNWDYSGANVELIVQCNLPDENPPLILGV